MVVVRGHLLARGKAKRADHALYLKPTLPLAGAGFLFSDRTGEAGKVETQLKPDRSTTVAR
jgi:hypothetical protein